jgi:hypothetical protein
MRSLSVWTLLLCALSAEAYSAPIVTLPPPVVTGTTYRLVFVTSGTRTGNFSNLEDYNTFVTNAANAIPELAALGVTWKAIASTDFISATTNIGASEAPIYRLDGVLVSISKSALFDGAIDAAINIDENGATVNEFARVWTGSGTDGTSEFGLGLIRTFARTGRPTTSDDWINWTLDGTGSQGKLYAISSEITAPGSDVPEPGSALMMAAGGVLVLLARRRRRA